MIRRRYGALPIFMAVFLVVLALVPLARAAGPTDGCCAKCIGKTSSVPYTYDPLVYAQCSAAGGVCCFGCDGEKATPTVENASFGEDGQTPQVKAGEWIQITWPHITRVTYESYKLKQSKTTTVVNGSAEATLEEKVFFVCAKAAGMVVVRGWGEDPCTTATPEFSIIVLAGSGSGTCASRAPTAPTTTVAASAGSSSTSKPVNVDPMVAQCNLQRASLVDVKGKQTCVCAAEWTGAPDCAGYPWWKTAATIGGGVAALLSIAVSVKAFANSRKAKEVEEEQQEVATHGGPVLGEESICIVGDPTTSNRVSNQAYEQQLMSVKARDKEYTL